MFLKDYQAMLLDDFADYLRSAQELGSASLAYQKSVREWKELSFAPPYYPLPGAEEVPYVCLRVPTGGGKTFLAAHSIEMVHQHYRPADTSLTIWLVPTEAIRSQTLRILKNREHPLTQSLRRAIGELEILDTTEALYVSRPTLDTKHTIIVATMQSFKRDDTSGLRVFKENGHLMDHFHGGIPEELKGNHSLVDVLRLRTPFIIVDEAHNQGTALALSSLAEFNPCAVLELTATPDRNHNPSNVLRSVSASQLQAEDMLKLPLELTVHTDWQVVLRDALSRRSQLEEIALEEKNETGEIIRPVLFIQAEKKKQGQEKMIPSVVKQLLIDDYKIAPNDIAICIGGLDEIGERQMEDADFPRVIITVDKLREGWDCPFAYVMMTFRGTTSKTAVEQVVGRVLRMPHVKRKKREALNRAYCYACSPDFAEVVRSLKDGLVESGFERMDVKDLIHIADSGSADDEDMFDLQEETAVQLPKKSDGSVVTPSFKDFTKSQQDKVELSPETGSVIFKGKPSKQLKEQVAAAISTAGGDDAAEIFKLDMEQNLAPRAKGKSPADYPSRNGAIFEVPRLMLRQEHWFDEFEQSHLLDGEWTLTDDFDFVLNEEEFSTKAEDLKQFRFEVTSGEVRYTFYQKQEQELLLNQREGGWSKVELVRWLDWNTDFHYADQPDKQAWLNRMIDELTEKRGADIESLAYRKFRLRQSIQQKLSKGLKLIEQKNFEDFFSNEDSFEVPGGEHCLTFKEGQYGYNSAYSGRYIFNKHFFPVIGDLKSQGEEFDCACRIDQHSDVEWWVRNVEKQPNAFWLQTSRGRFYPDFVVKLKSGKVVVIEYKGAHLVSDSKEKDDIGQLWERRSDGGCGFKMVANKDWTQLDLALKS